MKRPDPDPSSCARWSVAPAVEDEVATLARALGVPPLAARLLWLRGHRSSAAASRFLSPRLADLEPPAGLPDMALATARVRRALASGERIAVCGDYDVDGMTGTALLVRFLRLVGGDAVHAIPDREAEGYGLSVTGIDRLHAAGVTLAVTVDNGVGAHEAISHARTLGIDVVVTDHHLPGPTLPPALAVVDPRRADAGPAGRGLCGCGLAFKLAWGVAESLPSARADPRLRAFLRDAVGLVALATIADVMPLVGENRILVTAGLAALRASSQPGVRALLETAGVGAGLLSTADVSWRLAPRLNAAGRMNRPDVAIDLLTTDDPVLARALAGDVERMNDERRGIEKGVLEAAVEQARGRAADAGRRSLVVAGDGWHRGVIGIVASRLVGLHGRPTVVIGLDGEGGRGSCRTTADVDLHQALGRCATHLRRFGGHAAAAGLELDRGSLAAFEDAFEAAVREQAPQAADDALVLDGEAAACEFTPEVVGHVARLAPFGEDNPEPRFWIRGATVAGKARLMGPASEHLSFALRAGPGAVRVIAFRGADWFPVASCGEPIDLAVTPVMSEWRGVRTPELVAHAIRRSPSG